MKKITIILSLIFLLSSCGFTPIYLKNTNANFSIEQVTYVGDRELNNFLKTYLNQYKNENVENKIYIEANSVFEKIILSKNKIGKITDYQLVAEVKFLIKPKNKEIIINEKHIMNSISDKFEEARHERTIKQNFASSISSKLSSELIVN